MNKQEIKTIDIQAKEWFDRVNGNSYFSAIVTLNFGLEGEKQINIPFQYGYGDHYITIAFDQMETDGFLPLEATQMPAWRYCKENGIILRTSKKEKCLKSEVRNWIH